MGLSNKQIKRIARVLRASTTSYYIHTSPDDNFLETFDPGSVPDAWRVVEGYQPAPLFAVQGVEPGDGYAMSNSDTSTEYVIPVDEVNIVEKVDLDYDYEYEEDLDAEIAKRAGNDDLDSWEAQSALLAIAVDFGFDGVETEDEQGTVYILDGKKVISKLTTWEDSDYNPED